MIIYTTNILAGPLLLIIWAIDMCLFVVLLRLILGRLQNTRNGAFCQSLSQLVDPIPQAVAHRLTCWRGRPVPAWVAWATAIVGVLVIQHLLVWIAISVS